MTWPVKVDLIMHCYEVVRPTLNIPTWLDAGKLGTCLGAVACFSLAHSCALQFTGSRGQTFRLDI